MMRRVGQPAVLGELLIGVIVANAAFYFGQPVITVLREGETMRQVVEFALIQNLSAAEAARQLFPDSEHARQLVAILASRNGATALTIYQFVDLLSRVAVIILLFLVGLETSYTEMKRVGLTAFLVAIVGVVVPFALGAGAIELMIPDAPVEKAIFIGAILTATSVGITARVFRDLQQAHRVEAKIILGAAVIDDVLGLIVLAVVSALVVSGTVSLLSVTSITAKAAVFLAGSIGIGVWLTPKLVRRMARWDVENLKLLFGLGLAFVLSWLANGIGLAPIVGAFAAGLVLEELFLRELKGHSLRDLLSPIETLIVPVFFVLMGMQVKLETFTDLKVVGIATVLTAAAIVGKIVAGLVCSRKIDRLSVGVGMMPRGEVGLIFAGIGKGLGVVNDAVFSAVVIMVMVTTLLTPPLLKITLARSDRRKKT
jgi:Kef-type K+ transport system membrane component KefB